MSDKKTKKPNIDWEEEWKDMPEFVQGDKKAIKRVTINFETEEDIEKFNVVTGLKVTMKTKGVFYPKVDNRKIEYRTDNGD